MEIIDFKLGKTIKLYSNKETIKNKGRDEIKKIHKALVISKISV